MSASARLLKIVASVVGLAACGSVQGGGGDAGSDDGGVDGQGSGSDGGSSSEFLSCAGLPKTCGADGTDNCCNSPGVTGGTYYRSFDVAGDALSGNMSFPATITDFRLDRYEVTVGRFRAFVNAGMGTQANPPVAKAGEHPNIPNSGWDATWNINLKVDKAALIAAVSCDPMFQTWTDAPGANENRPMNCISWYEAMAFCAWDGGFLPTEAQWNYAAAAGIQQRAFPWSNPPPSLTVDPDHASFGGMDCLGDGMPGCTVNDLVVVGTKPLGDGRWGQADLAGNVAEWVLDFNGTYPSNCTDCANLAAAGNRIHRGGNFLQVSSTLRTGARPNRLPTDHNAIFGTRCARPLAPMM